MSVEPHPVGDSLNRRCSSYQAALSWARGTHQQKGWPLIDDAVKELDLVNHDPAPSYGFGKVRVIETSGSWSVSMSPRPWGWGEVSRVFFCPIRAEGYADQLRARLITDDRKRQQRRARQRRGP